MLARCTLSQAAGKSDTFGILAFCPCLGCCTPPARSMDAFFSRVINYARLPKDLISLAFLGRGATTFSKLGVQFLGLGCCTEQNTDGIPSFVHCSLQLPKKLGWSVKILAVRTH